MLGSAVVVEVVLLIVNVVDLVDGVVFGVLLLLLTAWLLVFVFDVVVDDAMLLVFCVIGVVGLWLSLRLLIWLLLWLMWLMLYDVVIGVVGSVGLLLMLYC